MFLKQWGLKNKERIPAYADAGLRLKGAGMSEDQTSNRAQHNLRPKTVVIAGSARLPAGVPAKHIFGCVTIEIEINLTDETIVDLSCTLVPSLGEKILRNVLIGNKVDEAVGDAVMQLETRFFNITRKAMIAALEDAHRRYKKLLQKIAVRHSE